MRGVVTKEGHAYAARIYENGRMRRLGTYSTPVQAALCYARYIGADQAAAETANKPRSTKSKSVHAPSWALQQNFNSAVHA
jgi:hypothetical protein